MDKLIFNTSGFNRQNIESTVSLTAIDSDYLSDNSFGTIVYKAEREEETYQIIFSFDTYNSKIDLSIAFAPALKASCLIFCGITLAGPILDCYKKNKGNWQAFKDCLADQGHAMGTSSLACIAACFF